MNRASHRDEVPAVTRPATGAPASQLRREIASAEIDRATIWRLLDEESGRGRRCCSTPCRPSWRGSISARVARQPSAATTSRSSFVTPGRREAMPSE